MEKVAALVLSPGGVEQDLSYAHRPGESWREHLHQLTLCVCSHRPERRSICHPTHDLWPRSWGRIPASHLQWCALKLQVSNVFVELIFDRKPIKFSDWNVVLLIWGVFPQLSWLISRDSSWFYSTGSHDSASERIFGRTWTLLLSRFLSESWLWTSLQRPAGPGCAVILLWLLKSTYWWELDSQVMTLVEVDFSFIYFHTQDTDHKQIIPNQKLDKKHPEQMMSFFSLL